MNIDIDEFLVKQLANKGKTINYIASQLKVHWSVISRIFKKLGLKKPRERGTPRAPINGIVICSKCIEPKSENNYWNNLTYCKKCHMLQSRNRRHSDLDANLGNMVSRIKHKCIKRGIKFDITRDQLLNIWEQQNGLCFYTNVPLQIAETIRSDRKVSPSLDRINPSEGYTKHNIVICSVRANTIKNDLSLDELRSWMPIWYKKIMKLYRKLELSPGDF